MEESFDYLLLAYVWFPWDWLVFWHFHYFLLQYFTKLAILSTEISYYRFFYFSVFFMTPLTFHESWAIILNWSVAYHHEPVSGMVTVSPVVGEAMVYDHRTKSLIDFPWEYDIWTHYIKAILAWWSLSYVIVDHTSSFAIITHKDALRHQACDTKISHWFVTSDQIVSYLTQLEKDGAVYVLPSRASS